MNMHNWNKGKWIFKDIHNLDYPFYHIHPYKQLITYELTRALPNWVTHVIVFGSSTHSSHMFWKDLDICLVGEYIKDTKYIELKDKFRCCDIIKVASMERLRELADYNFNSVYYNIMKEGVLVYEKI